MIKRVLTVLLAVLFVIPAIACGKAPEAPETETETGTAATETATDQEEYAEIDEYLTELAGSTDTEGMTFTYIGRQSDNFPKKDEETGDIQSDAVYFRQRDLTEIFRLNWEPVITENGDATKDTVINEVTAGGDSYDLVFGNVITVSQHLLNAGVILRVDTLDDYIDLDRPWWVGSLRDVYSVGGKLFILRGDIAVENFEDPTCVMFNKTVTSMFSIDDSELYSLAAEGKWTLDEFERVASNIPENPTGKGVFRYANFDGIEFIFSCGMTITKFDENGYPYLEDSLPVELVNLSDRTSGMFGDRTQTACWDWLKGESKASVFGVEDDYDWFLDNKALFFTASTGKAIGYRQFDVVFGILPMPKGSASQASYYSYADPWGSGSVTIPKTTKNVPATATVTEGMAALSTKYVKTAYYDMLLRGQSVFDMESRDMLDIIFDTIIYDMVDLYSGGDMSSWGPLMNDLHYAMSYDNSSIVSDYKANVRVTKYYIKTLIQAVENMD
ncbi:MAG: hypothetical protein II503_01515 [Clostridia bacterium]|nr:hypothetical protein [Clostridia bacterium]